jgi:hypothetical protein
MNLGGAQDQVSFVLREAAGLKSCTANLVVALSHKKVVKFLESISPHEIHLSR